MSSGARARDRELFEILLDTELVAAAPLEKAQREALTTSRPLWRILLRDGLCKEDDLFQILNQLVRAPVLAEDQLKSVVVPEELRGVVGPELAQRLGVLPLERSTDGRRAALAMVDPTADLSAIWTQLVRLGIAEVRRFLLHAQTFRLGFEVFYGRPYEPDDVAPPETIPEPHQPEAPRRERREASSPRVMLDPSLAAEMEQLEHPRPAETSFSSASTPVLHPPAPAAPPAPVSRSLNSQETPRRQHAPVPDREPVAPASPPTPPAQAAPTPAVSAAVSAAAAPAHPAPSTVSGGISVGAAASSQSLKPLPPPVIPSVSAAPVAAASPTVSGGVHVGTTASSSQSIKPPPSPVIPSVSAAPVAAASPAVSGGVHVGSTASSSQSIKPPPSPMIPSISAAPVAAASPTVSGGVHVGPTASSSQSLKPPPLPVDVGHGSAGAPARELAMGPSGAAQSSSQSLRPAVPPEVPTPPATPVQAPTPVLTPTPIQVVVPAAVSSMQPDAEPLRNTKRSRRDVSIPELSADEFFEETPEPQRPPVRTSRPPGPLGSLRPLAREQGLELAREFSKDADLEISAPAAPAEKVEAPPSSRSENSGASALFAAFAPSDPAQEALLAASLTLLSAYEEIVGTSRAALLSRLSQATANRLGFTTRATREVCLVAWLHGILTARVQARATASGQEAPPVASDGRLGFQCDDPLQSVLESLQSVLVDFMRLPGEQDLLPIGIRLVRAAECTLELVKTGVEGESLLYRIDEEIRDSEMAAALRRVVESELQSLGITAEAAAANPEGATAGRSLLTSPTLAPLPAAPARPSAPVVQVVGAPLAPALPQVAWETVRLDSIDELSAEGLLPHPAPPSPDQSS